MIIDRNLHLVIRYSRSLRPRLSRDSAAKLTLYGEDPVKGVVGPGQLRRGSYQGENKKRFFDNKIPHHAWVSKLGSQCT